MGTVTSPGGPSPGGSFLDKVGDLLIDVGRARLIDVERPSDDNNIPDQVDVRTGQAPAVAAPSTPGVPGGLAPWQWAGLAVAAGLTFALLTGRFR